MRAKGSRPRRLARAPKPISALALRLAAHASDPHRPGLHHPRLPGRDRLPEPLSLPGLRFVPDCEAGVVALFAILAPNLGYTIEKLSPRFPDCVALRRISRAHWQRVRIEFEFESRNFTLHRHDPAACDVIVCWRHTWPQCPKSLEVLALEQFVAPTP